MTTCQTFMNNVRASMTEIIISIDNIIGYSLSIGCTLVSIKFGAVILYVSIFVTVNKHNPNESIFGINTIKLITGISIIIKLVQGISIDTIVSTFKLCINPYFVEYNDNKKIVS